MQMTWRFSFQKSYNLVTNKPNFSYITFLKKFLFLLDRIRIQFSLPGRIGLISTRIHNPTDKPSCGCVWLLVSQWVFEYYIS